MRRREFIALVGGAAVWPVAARAEQAGKLPTIGYLGDDALSWSSWTARFVERLRELGWSAGQNISIEYRWSKGRPEGIGKIAAEFVQQNVNVIVTYGGAVAGLRQATAVIPMSLQSRLIRLAVASSRAFRTGGNVTGYPSSRATLPASALSFCVRLFPAFADWRSCLMAGIPPPFGK